MSSVSRVPEKMTVLEELHGMLDLRILQSIALTILLAGVSALGFLTKYSVRDPDLWWHLKVGDWILQNHSVPHTGLFSRTAGSHPWMAYSWGYEALLSVSYSWFHLMGIGVFGVLLILAAAITLFWSLRQVSGRFWLAWILTIVSSTGFLFNIMPRPVFASMALFAITVTVLLQVQHTGRTRPLYWLPLLFCLWANIHIQFVYGLFAVGLFVGMHIAYRLFGVWLRRLDWLAQPQTLSIKLLLGILAASTLATCVGPYFYHVYDVVFKYSQAKVTYSIILELLPLNFMSFSHFAELFLAASAFFVIGWTRKLDLFKAALLTAACVFAFRTTRDAWFLCITSAIFIADSLRTEHEYPEPRPQLAERAGIAAVLVLVGYLIAINTGFTPRGLDATISNSYPVDAANFLRRNPYPGPIFNSFDWGGFLIWYLPQYPVSVDGRNDLYGDNLDSRLYGVESGDNPYQEEPAFNESRLMLLQNDVPLAISLSMDPRYEAVYRDKMAVIYVRR